MELSRWPTTTISPAGCGATPGSATAMGGLAARLAGRALSRRRRSTAARHAADLKAALGGIKGPLMKVAQLLATIPDALPEEYAGELASCRPNAPPMGWHFVKRRMASELGPDWQRRFKSFEHEAARAASLGQVHRAVGHDGTAARLQAAISRHGLGGRGRSAASSSSCCRIYERYDRAVTTDEIHAEIADAAARGTGLRARGRAYAALPPHAGQGRDRRRGARAGAGAVDAPAPHHDLARGHAAARRRRGAARRCATGSRATCSAPGTCRFYYYGVIHGDPHLGNYTVRPDRSASTCWISAACAFSRRDSSRASSISITRSTATTGARGRRPTRAGASRS